MAPANGESDMAFRGSSRGFFRRSLARIGLAALASPTVVPAQTGVASSGAASGPEVHHPGNAYFYDLDLPGPPFSVVTTADQHWAFVSLAGARDGKPLGVAVLRHDGRRFALERTIATPSLTHGLALTRDGRTLVAAAGNAILLLDVAKMIQGQRTPLMARIPNDANAGSVYVNVAPDGSTLFASDERAARITVIDLRRTLAEGFSAPCLLGHIPVGRAPIALTFSPDGRWLFTTSQVAPPEWGWPRTIRREGQPAEGGTLVPEGAVIVVDVEKAKRDPAHAVVARVPSGGSPVRLAISPAGDRAYVTARNSDALLVFDTAKLITGDPAARIATVPVGTSPVGVLVVDDGRRIFVTNSNRFSADTDRPSTFNVVDATKVGEGSAAVIATLPAGAFPREWCLTPDQKTVLLTNYRSRTVRVIDLARLPVP